MGINYRVVPCAPIYASIVWQRRKKCKVQNASASLYTFYIYTAVRVVVYWCVMVRRTILHVAILGASLAVASGVRAQNTTWLTNLSSALLETIGLIVPTLIAVAVVVFAWGAVVFMAKADNEQARAEGKKRMVWGVVAIFVLVSVWGFVEILQNILGVWDGVAPPKPTVGI